MDQKLKERVFGALVVIAIAVIFVPMLLDKNHDEAINISEAIPLPPKAANIVNPPEQVVELESMLTPANLEAETRDNFSELEHSNIAIAEVKKPIDIPIANMIPAPEAKVQNKSGWAIQMGTFANRENAQALERKLKRKGYAVFLHDIENNNKKFTKVIVGPQAKREEAVKLLSKLEENAEAKGVVIRYEPLA